MSAPNPRVPPLLPWLIAGSLALLCAWLAQLLFTLRAQNALLRDQQALLELELRSVRQQLEAERILSRHQIDAQRSTAP